MPATDSKKSDSDSSSKPDSQVDKDIEKEAKAAAVSAAKVREAALRKKINETEAKEKQIQHYVPAAYRKYPRDMAKKELKKLKGELHNVTHGIELVDGPAIAGVHPALSALSFWAVCCAALLAGYGASYRRVRQPPLLG